MFFCISYYQGKLDFIQNIDPQNFVIYSKGEDSISNAIKIENWGYNLSSYFKFIIDNYDNLPERICFTKNNVYPRHVDKTTFEDCISRDGPFVGIESKKHLTFRKNISFYNREGYFEKNNSWYMTSKDSKYFYNFNDFMNFYFDNYKPMEFINFVPGANFIVDHKLILKYPPTFYKSLNYIMSHTTLSNESHLIERALKLIFTADLNLKTTFYSTTNIEELEILCRKNKSLKRLRLFKLLNKIRSL